MQRWVLAAACLTQAGCFHQAFNTGLPAGTTGVTKSWHPTFIFGLVQAAPVDVRTTCPRGVAIASTRMTFANGLVGGLTLGLFTPHEVKVVCASSTAGLDILETRHLAADATHQQATAVLSEAVALASSLGGNVAIVIEPAPSSTDTLESIR